MALDIQGILTGGWMPSQQGGGGGGGWVNQPNWGAIQYAMDRENDAKVEKQDRISKYNKWLTDTISGFAPRAAIQYATSRGLDAANPDIKAVLDQIVGSIGSSIERDQDSGVNPEKFFSPQAFDQGLTDAQSRKRQAYQAQVQSMFTPNIESSVLPDSDIDMIVDQILGEQKNLANTSLGYQSKRGLLTSTGTEQAQKSLEGQSSAARSTLTDLARGALSKNRQDLLDIVGRAGSAANNWTFGSPAFDPSSYKTEFDTRAASERAGFGGDVRAALGDTELFDLPSIVAKAGQAQGPQNLTIGDSGGVGPRKKSPQRGLGSQGGGF